MIYPFSPPWGLSPRLRGNGDLTELRLNIAGSIPALAGERFDGGQHIA